MLKKKPIYYQKSKAAKKVEQNYNDYSTSPLLLSDFPRTYKGHQRGRKERHIRDYKYNGYEDQYKGRPYGYDSLIQSMYDRPYIYGSEMYDMRNDIYGYSTQESQSQLRNRGNKPYIVTETAYSDESDSEWWDRHRRRGDSVSDSIEYTSEYSYKEGHPRQIYYDRNPYKKNFNVFVAQQPSDHRAFRYRQYKPMKQTSYTTISGTETVTDEENSYIPMREQVKQPKQQVYVTQVEQDQAKVFGQKVTQNSHERVLSVTEYDRNIPIIMLKDKKQNNSTIKNQHEVVYMPCVVLDNNIKLSKSKIIPPESLIERIKETKNKPLETNVHIYAATDTGIGNIFKQEVNNPTKEDMPLLVQDKTNSVHGGISKSVSKVKTTSSVARVKSTTSEDSMSQLYYPVQKSYINVAPSKLKSRKTVDKKRSLGTIRSLIGMGKQGSIRGSGISSKIKKKDLVDKRELKRKLLKQKEPSKDSEILAIVYPTTNEKEIEHEDDKVLSTNGYYQEVQNNKKHNVVHNNTTQRKASDVLSKTISFSKLHQKSIINHKDNRPIDKEGISRSRSRKSIGREIKGISVDEKDTRKSIGREIRVISVDEKDTRKSIGREIRGISGGEIKGTSVAEKDVRKSIGKEIKGSVSKTTLGIKKKLPNEKRSLKYGQKSKSSERSKTIYEQEVTGEEVLAKEKELKNIYGRYESFEPDQREDIYKPARQSIQTTESRVMSHPRKSFIQKIFKRKKKDPVSKPFESKVILDQTESRSVLSIIPQDYEQRTVQPVYPPVLLDKQHEERILRKDDIAESYEQRAVQPVLPPVLDEQPQEKLIKKKHVSKTRSLTKTITKEYIDELNKDLKPETSHQFKVWGYDLAPIIIFTFEKAEYFLGLSLHDTLLEAMYTFVGDDLT